MVRESKKARYLSIAGEVGRGSTCLRRQYGVIIVREVPGYHNFGVYLNEKTGIFVHNCVAVHAEVNAIISAARRDMIGGTLYLAGWEDGKRIENPQPCEICAKLIKNAGIKEVIVCE